VPAVYQQNIAADLVITSIATPRLNGTYTVDDGAAILISGVYRGSRAATGYSAARSLSFLAEECYSRLGGGDDDSGAPSTLHPAAP
jgi:hypothetical protein